MLMSGKLTVLGLVKLKVFRNKSYDVVLFVHNFTNKMLSRGSNHIVNHVIKIW